MPHFGSIKRRDLIACLRRLGFTGPYAGGKHEFMQKGDLSLTIPNPHGREIGPSPPAPSGGHPAERLGETLSFDGSERLALAGR
jgi:predicted RNA binding protein YcfA (HicA-like mRNA interferase family)